MSGRSSPGGLAFRKYIPDGAFCNSFFTNGRRNLKGHCSEFKHEDEEDYSVSVKALEELSQRWYEDVIRVIWLGGLLLSLTVVDRAGCSFMACQHCHPLKCEIVNVVPLSVSAGRIMFRGNFFTSDYTYNPHRSRTPEVRVNIWRHVCR